MNYKTFDLEVRVGGQRAARASLTMIPTAPGIFGALNQDGRVNATSNPVRPGQVLQIFASGQGQVTPAVEAGAAAPAHPLSVTALFPEVFVGGRRAASSAGWPRVWWAFGRSTPSSPPTRRPAAPCLWSSSWDCAATRFPSWSNSSAAAQPSDNRSERSTM